MEVRPLGSSHVVLKQFRDHFTFKKCVTYVRNILFGEIYIDNVGEMKFRNHTTKDTATLTLTERGWGDKVFIL
jgi:Oxysterol-binding protein